MYSRIEKVGYLKFLERPTSPRPAMALSHSFPEQELALGFVLEFVKESEVRKMSEAQRCQPALC